MPKVGAWPVELRGELATRRLGPFAQVVHAPVLIARAVGAGALPRVQRRRHGVRVALEQVDLGAAWVVAALDVAIVGGVLARRVHLHQVHRCVAVATHTREVDGEAKGGAEQEELLIRDLVPAHQVEPVLHEVQLVVARHVQHIGRARHHRTLRLAAPAVVLRHKATELAAARVDLHWEAHRVEQAGRADGHERMPHPPSAREGVATVVRGRVDRAPG